MQTFTKKSIKQELFSKLEPDKEFTLKDAYEAVTSTDKKHSIRARIYECVDKGLFLKVSKGVYKMVDTEENSVLLVQGNGRDLSMIQNQIKAVTVHFLTITLSTTQRKTLRKNSEF